jgi:hypothetical protein
MVHELYEINVGARQADQIRMKCAVGSAIFIFTINSRILKNPPN